MKKIAYIVAFTAAVSLLTMCKEPDELLFAGGIEDIYFRLPEPEDDEDLILRKNTIDTIAYTFAYDPELTEREVRVPVEITGLPHNTDRTYHIEITTATGTVSGVDFKPISTTQTVRSGLSKDYISVVFLRNASMEEEVKSIKFRVLDGGDFKEGLVESLEIVVQASDILERPGWWPYWEANAFGPWHPKKLREWIKIWGGKGELPAASGHGWLSYPNEYMAILKLRAVFEQAAKDGDESFLGYDGKYLTIPANF